ncbi:MAG: acyltransferase [Bacteroidales bacterium]|jgi:peptidoglycan/LPS O-acetylase OafA/YrhL|nr:acyltransferase [Bacteroidales bacterium]
MKNLSSKPHYEILDGLRGVAALMVLGFHVLEAYAIGKYGDDSCYYQILNHAYLAVDFFFVLSGFVIGYAYDDRWDKMSFGNFFRRRVIRLHPMVVFGTVLGVILFYFGASVMFPLVSAVPWWKVLAYALLGVLMIPASPGMDIRGWQEMYTLDAPTWSLAFEYIANIFYGLFVRRFSKVALTIFVALAACATLHLTLTQGDVIGGWTLNAHHLYVGFTRLLYPFFAGLLLFRLGKTVRTGQPFLISTLLLVAVLVVPRIGDKSTVWMNGLYEAAVILLVFPLIVAIGAGGTVKSRFTSRLCKFLGDMSYPIYLVNYPLCYIHTGWISDTNYSMSQAGWVPVAVFSATLVISWLALKFFDIPVRRWLSGKSRKK